jgi:hypothetical protein
MRHFLRDLLPMALLAGLTTTVAAQDGKVTYRDPGGKGVQTASGKIESESVAGVRVGGRTVSSADIVDVQYELPAAVRLDYNSAASTEAAKPAEAIKGYEALAKTPQVQNNRLVKRHLEYKVAALTAAQADEGPVQLQRAIAALEKFRKDHPDAWQLVPLTRTLGRLQLDREPPDLEAARQAYDDLARTNGVPADVRQELTLLAIDVLTQAGKLTEAQQRLALLPASDPRVQLYQVGLRATPANLAETVKQLEDAIAKTADPSLKAAAYNVLGDCYRRDPQHKKDALYAYLWVDVIYNQDPIEVNRAVARLASLFAELKDDDRAKKYRDRLRGKLGG